MGSRNGRKFTAFAGIALAALLAGCGGAYDTLDYNAKADAYKSTYKQDDERIVYEDGNYGATAPSGTGNTSSGGSIVYGYPVRAIGYTSWSVEVPVRRILKLRFTPGIQDEKVAGTGFSPNYSKMGVYLQVGDTSRATPLLNNGLIGAAQSSPVMDFSSAFVATCPTLDTACRQAVVVTVKMPNTDYYCLNFGDHCSHARVADGHPWNGILEIQTDDTEVLQ